MVISPLNYTGNKAKLLKEILPMLPSDMDIFYDVFAGSGMVSVNSSAKKIIFNDISKAAVSLFKYFAESSSEKIIINMENIINNYGLTYSRIRPKGTYIEYKHEGLSLYNKEAYNKMRQDYNTSIEKPVETLFALCVYGFNHYIRFNRKDEYNVPVGKVDFSSSLYQKTIDFSNILKSKTIELQNRDFREIDIIKNAFYYFDPPYMITDAPYNKFWTKTEESDLLNLIDELNRLGIKFALSNVFFSNGKTNYQLIDWAKKYNVYEMKRQYKNANYRKHNHSPAKEVLITNYKMEN